MTSHLQPNGEGAAGSGVGIVGLGAMGLRLATTLAEEGGTTPLVFDVNPEATARATEAGLTVASDLSRLVGCEAIVLSLPTPAIVLGVVEELATAAASAGSRPTVLDTSTIGPRDARAVAEVAGAAGLAYADCPILGRPESVGRWTIPVGGDEAAVAVAARVLAPATARVEGVGPVGTASVAKILNNLMLGTINAVTAELLVLAEAAGLDPGRWVDLIVDSGAASVSPLFRDIAARAVDGDFAPTFSLALMHKDNGLALSLAEELDVPMITGAAAQQLNSLGLEAGLGAEDSIAVLKVLESRTGRSARRHTASNA